MQTALDTQHERSTRPC